MNNYQEKKEQIENKFKNIKVISMENFPKIELECLKHGKFSKRFYDLMKSDLGCPKCSNEKKSEETKISPEKFILKAKKIHGDKYDYSKVNVPINGTNDINIICPIHGEFTQKVKSHLNGCGCPKCGMNKTIDSQRLTTEIVIDNCKKVYGDKYDYSKVNWIDSDHKITITCHVHGDFETNYFDFLKGHECPKCYEENNRLKNEKTFKENIQKLNNNKIIFPKDFKYINSYTNVKIIYDGEVIERDPHTLLKGKVLSKNDKEEIKRIAGVKKSKTRWTNLENELDNLYGDSLVFDKNQIDFIKSGETDENFEMDVKCKKHGKFRRSLFKIINGYGCPSCMYKKTSAAEKEIVDYIKTIYFGKIIENDRVILKGKELDIYFPDINIAIEYDGLYWHNNVNNYFKYDECRKKGVRLIQINEYEWKFDNEKTKFFLNSLFFSNYIKIGARKCDIKEIDNETYKKFCNENHMQGYSPSSIRIGLYHDNELIEAEGFSKARFGDYEWELIRECSKKNYSVIGGKSKILKYFEKVYKPKEIISYCEKNKFSGKSYYACGFKLDHESSPGYSYYKDGKKYSRMMFQKYKLSTLLKKYDDALTESENMINNHYFKIYDYGNFVFLKKLDN